MQSDPAVHRAVVLLGCPGAGKGTVARRLQADHGYVHVDMGRILRQRATCGDTVGAQVAIAQARGIMVPKETVLSALTSHLESLPRESQLVLDGFPRTSGQVAAADDGRVPVDVTVAIWLDVPADVAAARLHARRGAHPRIDDAPDVIATRLSLTNQTVDAVRALYERRGMLEHVDATGCPADVYAQVESCLGQAFSMV